MGSIGTLLKETGLGMTIFGELLQTLRYEALDITSRIEKDGSDITSSTLQNLIDTVYRHGFEFKVYNNKWKRDLKKFGQSLRSNEHLIRLGEIHNLVLTSPKVKDFRERLAIREELKSIVATVSARFKFLLQIDALQNKSFIQEEFSKVQEVLLLKTTNLEDLSAMYVDLFSKMFNSFYSVGKNGRLDLRSFHRGAIYSRKKGSKNLRFISETKLGVGNFYSEFKEAKQDKRFAIDIIDGEKIPEHPDQELVMKDPKTGDILIYSTLRDHPEFNELFLRDVQEKKFRAREIARSTFVKLDETEDEELILMMIGPDLVNLKAYMQNVMGLLPQLRNINALFRHNSGHMERFMHLNEHARRTMLEMLSDSNLTALGVLEQGAVNADIAINQQDRFLRIVEAHIGALDRMDDMLSLKRYRFQSLSFLNRTFFNEIIEPIAVKQRKPIRFELAIGTSPPHNSRIVTDLKQLESHLEKVLIEMLESLNLGSMGYLKINADYNEQEEVLDISIIDNVAYEKKSDSPVKGRRFGDQDTDVDNSPLFHLRELIKTHFVHQPDRGSFMGVEEGLLGRNVWFKLPVINSHDEGSCS